MAGKTKELGALLILSCSFPLGKGCNLGAISTDFHAAPLPRAFLARVVKVKYAAQALPQARRGNVAQQIGDRMRDRRKSVFRIFTGKPFAPLQAGFSRN